MELNALRFSCPHCKADGRVKFDGAISPFGFVSVDGDFRLEVDKPRSALRCKCGRMLVVVRSEQGTCHMVDTCDRNELSSLANRLMNLHHTLEDEGKMDADWSLARSLEDRIGAFQGTTAKDISSADALLAKHGL